MAEDRHAGEDRELSLLVIGAGPCGLAVGAAARQAGIDCLLLDRGPIVRSIERYPVHMSFFSTADRLEIGGVPFTCERDKPTRGEALAYYRRVARHFDLRVCQYEEVVAVEPGSDGFTVRSRRLDGGERLYRARRVVLATGNFDRFNPLDVPGEELAKVTHYFREAHRYYDQDVAVVGGGNSAVEAALDVWRAGGRVTLVHLLDDFDRGVKPWVLPDIRNRIAEGSIEALWRHRVEAIEPGRIRVRSLDEPGERVLANDWVLAMTGYRPDYGLLTAAGGEVDPDGAPVFDSETCETTVPGLYVAGVITVGQQSGRVFIENGREHGPAIVRHMETLSR